MEVDELEDNKSHLMDGDEEEWLGIDDAAIAAAMEVELSPDPQSEIAMEAPPSPTMRSSTPDERVPAQSTSRTRIEDLEPEGSSRSARKDGDERPRKRKRVKFEEETELIERHPVEEAEDEHRYSWRDLLDGARLEPEDTPKGEDIDGGTHEPPAPPRKSLFDAYHAVPSPTAELAAQHPGRSLSDLWLKAVGLTAKQAGIKTELYGYQTASVLKMLQREQCPRTILLPVQELGRPLETREFIEPRGGLLAETMGTGKTLICIALMMATKGELASVEQKETLLTPVSAGFQTDVHRKAWARKWISYEPEDLGAAANLWERDQVEAARIKREHAASLTPTAITKRRVPSLKNLALHVVATRRLHRAHTFRNKSLPSSTRSRLSDNRPFYFDSTQVQAATATSRLRRISSLTLEKSPAPKIQVSYTNLVVLPPALIKQWEGEFEAHVSDERRVDTYSVYLRSKEARKKKGKQEDAFEDDELHSKPQNNEKQLKILVIDAQVPERLEKALLVQYDVVLMSAFVFAGENERTPRSALEDIYWKRLILDEGHVLGGHNNSRALASRMLAEGRWAVSGTPSKTLRAEQTDEQEALFPSQRQATNVDSHEFPRLEGLFRAFLKAPYAASAAAWRAFRVPFQATSQNAVGVERAFAGAVIKHAPQYLSPRLPKLHVQVVELPHGRLESLTYNAIRALFVLNSVESERGGPDYLFASNNKKRLAELARNLLLSGFFFASSETIKWLRFAVDTVNAGLNTAAGREARKKQMARWGEEDRQAYKAALEHIEAALEDDDWRRLISSQNPGLSVTGPAASELRGEWRGWESAGKISYPTDRLALLKAYFQELRWRNPDMVEDESLIQELNKIGSRRNLKKSAFPEDDLPFSQRPRLDSLPAPSPLADDSIFRRFALGASTSTKINHVINELQAHPTEKFFIFGSLLPDLTLAMLSEALDLVGVAHKVLGTTKDAHSTLHHFVTSDAATCQALLIKASLGGQGLHLVVATRVIFIEPIWEADLEAQAVRRAHRVGQTKEVHMQTLVLKGSFEQHLLQQRNALGDSREARAKSFQDDNHLRDVLQQADFLNDPVPTARAETNNLFNSATLDGEKRPKKTKRGSKFA